MNKEFLARMSSEELDEYAKCLGIELRPAKTKEDKIALITRRRERTAQVSALGMDFDIPIKRAHDKRIIDLMEKPDRTDEETYEVMALFLGEQQFEKLIEACTEEDGTIDIDALGIAFVKIITSDELKNF